MTNLANPALVDFLTDFLVELGRPYPTRALSEGDIREMVQQHRDFLRGIAGSMLAGEPMAWEFSGQVGSVIMNDPALLRTFLERGVVVEEGAPPIASANHLTQIRAFRDIAQKTQRPFGERIIEVAVAAVLPAPATLSIASH